MERTCSSVGFAGHCIGFGLYAQWFSPRSRSSSWEAPHLSMRQSIGEWGRFWQRVIGQRNILLPLAAQDQNSLLDSLSLSALPARMVLSILILTLAALQMILAPFRRLARLSPSIASELESIFNLFGLTDPWLLNDVSFQGKVSGTWPRTWTMCFGCRLSSQLSSYMMSLNLGRGPTLIVKIGRRTWTCPYLGHQGATSPFWSASWNWARMQGVQCPQK